MASENTFDHWKVVFSWGKMRKSRFSQNPLNSRFWALGFLIYTLSCANFKKDRPWQNLKSLSLCSCHWCLQKDTMSKRRKGGDLKFKIVTQMISLARVMWPLPSQCAMSQTSLSHLQLNCWIRCLDSHGHKVLASPLTFHSDVFWLLLPRRFPLSAWMKFMNAMGKWALGFIVNLKVHKVNHL